jgi:hypothetical protein
MDVFFTYAVSCRNVDVHRYTPLSCYCHRLPLRLRPASTPTFCLLSTSYQRHNCYRLLCDYMYSSASFPLAYVTGCLYLRHPGLALKNPPKKTHPKKPTQKTQKNPLKKTQKKTPASGFFWFFLKGHSALSINLQFFPLKG